MARRTIYLPEKVEALARDSAREGESFSATVARLIEDGARSTGVDSPLEWIGSGEGPSDLGMRSESYLREVLGRGRD